MRDRNMQHVYPHGLAYYRMLCLPAFHRWRGHDIHHCIVLHEVSSKMMPFKTFRKLRSSRAWAWLGSHDESAFQHMPLREMGATPRAQRVRRHSCLASGGLRAR